MNQPTKRVLTEKLVTARHTIFITACLTVRENTVNNILCAVEQGDENEKFKADYHVTEILIIDNEEKAMIKIDGSAVGSFAKTLQGMQTETLAPAKQLYNEYMESL